jgi:hypothetical protein
MKSARSPWVLLAFRIPREPSTPRIAVWRKLKRVGAVQLLDGLVALPNDRRNREQLDWIAQDITDAGGEAKIWIGETSSAEDEREIVERMQTAIAADYQRVIDEAEAASAQPQGRRRRSVARLRREMRRVRERDYFPPPERETAQQAVDALGASLEDVSGNGVPAAARARKLQP